MDIHLLVKDRRAALVRSAVQKHATSRSSVTKLSYMKRTEVETGQHELIDTGSRVLEGRTHLRLP